MTEKELKRMSRQELLDELYKYARDNASLHLRLENMEEEMKQQQAKFEETLAAEHRKVLLIGEEIKNHKRKNEELSKKLRDRTVVMEDAGNLAEATCKITGIFEEAQKTAEVYVKNVKDMAARQEKALKEMEEKSRQDIQKLGDEASKTCIAMRSQTEKECAALRKKTEEDCQKMETDAYARAEAYWNNLTVRLENFYDAHQGMRELFGDNNIRIPSFNK